MLTTNIQGEDHRHTPIHNNLKVNKLSENKPNQVCEEPVQ